MAFSMTDGLPKIVPQDLAASGGIASRLAKTMGNGSHATTPSAMKSRQIVYART
jgi:hypothetical protein